MNKNKTTQVLEKIVKRLDSIEEKMVTKDDLRKEMSNYPTKKDLKKVLKRMEDRITKKLNSVVDHFDSENMEVKDILDKVEKRVDLFTSA